MEAHFLANQKEPCVHAEFWDCRDFLKVLRFLHKRQNVNCGPMDLIFVPIWLPHVPIRRGNHFSNCFSHPFVWIWYKLRRGISFDPGLEILRIWHHWKDRNLIYAMELWNFNFWEVMWEKNGETSSGLQCKVIILNNQIRFDLFLSFPLPLRRWTKDQCRKYVFGGRCLSRAFTTVVEPRTTFSRFSLSLSSLQLNLYIWG